MKSDAAIAVSKPCMGYTNPQTAIQYTRRTTFPSIPQEAHQRVFDLDRQGLVVRRFTRALDGIGVYTSRSSVDGLLGGCRRIIALGDVVSLAAVNGVRA